MPARQPVPTLWLFTDERADIGLERALGRLPRGAGIVFRHHATPRAARRARFETVRRIAKARGLVLILAGDPRDAIGWGADGWHGRGVLRLPLRFRTAPVHDPRELVAARRAGVDVAFVSPVFATRSHPGAPALGPIRLGQMAKRSTLTIVALGGMDARRYRRMRALGASGWAAIDAWSS
ncbi:thiamine phosphate synthase [Sphingomonas sp. BIUV-7]|uniref:Thiamine phosphate synthase n=1 Tax=Sphingomonas natans TaxID=3063330 RepID=A0ABT8YCG0_9SPHN|nr:thiamine phosphate synthase [Sphingomonas sp. BIUV-7]MDO6416017.1 thiamine phosphate synthase [Sphingomonas sp. BIUV-7]